MQWEYNRTNFERNLAVVIGIDRYNSDSIHDLSTPVSDARAFADLLETKYEYKSQYKSHNVIRLFDQAATLTGLQTLLNDTLPNQLKPTKGDRLIFYFAGHGIPRNSQDGPEGYLVPQDADWHKEDSFLSMSKVYEALSQLECHHLLVILDCCFAGTFRWAGRRKMIPILKTVRREHYDRFIRYPAWQVITSAAHDQEALDVAKLAEDKRGEVRDEKQELHSPFALALLEGLRENKADVIPDGVITAHELYVYLEQQVSKLSGERQRPGIYPMRLEYDRGEFVFTRPGFTSSQLKPAPLLNESNNPYRGLASFDEKYAHFFFGRKALVEELQRRLSQPNRSLTVVLGASGSGKSSLVKAGLIPDLRQESKWYILDPMRPDRSPFTALARAILPIEKPELIEQLSQVSFLDEVFKPKDESGQDDSDEPADAAFVKLVESWNSAKSEAKLLLVEDYFKQLLALCRNPQEKEQLSQLYRAIFEKLESLSNRLQNEPQHLSRVIRKWSETHPDAKLLLTIDQFEELITMSQESQTETDGGDRQEGDSPNERVGERAAESQPWLPFLQVLLEAIVEGQKQLHIVLTLRSDFEQRFLSSPLSAYWKDARFPVRAMNLDELRQAIEGPALKQALYFEPPELVGKLIDEVGQMPGALPLLSFTLSELYAKLYERWKPGSTDRALRIKDYEELGGVTGALTRRATQEYDNLVRDFGEASGKAYQATMRRVMLRMVAIEGGGVARRRVPESELVYSDGRKNKHVDQIIQRLVKARLLVTGQEVGSQRAGKEIAEGYVEPAHDFLVNGWEKLQAWIKEEQEQLFLRQRLNVAANAWIRREGSLWVEEVDRLIKLNAIINSNDSWLNRLETIFVKRSSKVRQDRIKKLEEDLRISEQRRIKAELQEKAIRAENILPAQPLDSIVVAIQAMGQNLDELSHEILGAVQSSFLTSLQISQETNILQVRTSQDYAYSVAISLDGEYIVSGTGSGKVRLWDKYGNPINLPFVGHTPVNPEPCSENVLVSISGNGEYIVSGSGDRKVFIYNTKKESTKIFEVPERVTGVTISADGQYIAVSNYKDLYVLNNDGKLLQGWTTATGVTSVAISSDGNYIVSGGQDGAVALWNKNGSLIHTFVNQHNEISHNNISSVAINYSGEYIVSGSQNGAVALWSKNGDLIHVFPGQKQFDPTSVAISSDGRYIFGAKGNSYTVHLWDQQNNFNEEVFRSDNIYISSIAVSSNGKTIAIVLGDIKLWERNEYSTSMLFENDGISIRKIAIAPDKEVIVSGGEDGSIGLWNFQGKPLYSFKGHEERINAVAVSSDGKIIITGGDDGIVKFWDKNGFSLIQPIPIERLRDDYGSYISSIALSSNGKLIIVGTEDGAIWRINRNGKIMGQPLIEEKGFVTSIAVDPENKIIAIASSSRNTIRLADFAGNFLDKSFMGHTQGVSSTAFSPDGKHIVSGSHDNTLRLWDINGFQIGTAFFGHEDSVTSVAFSPDGQYIVSGSLDQTVRIWNLQGNPIGKPLVDHKEGIGSVIISPNGKYIFSSSSGQVRRWEVGSWSNWLEVACNRLQYHPVLKNPQTEEQRGARATCQQYVWHGK